MATKIDYVALARRQHERDEELALQEEIVRARDLYEGWMSGDMKDRLQEAFLAEDSADLVTELANLYALVIDEVLDRLSVIELAGQPVATSNQGQAGNAAATGASEFSEAPQWAVDFWRYNKLNQFQHDIYLRALRDGSCFVLLQPETDYLNNTIYIRAYIHERFTAADAQGPTGNGTGEGMMAHYADDTLTLNKPPLAYSKRWTEVVTDTNGDEESFQRMTLYIAPNATERGRIEKYRQEDDEWKPHKDEGDELYPLNPWEYPIPVVEFSNIGRKLQGKRAIGLQMAIDNTVTALVMGAGTVAVPGGFITGAHPTTDGQVIAEDGSNMMRFGPGRFNGLPDKLPSEAKMEWLKPGDLSQMIAAIDQLVKLMSMTTKTPSLLQNRLGSLPVAARLLQQLDIQVVAQAKRVQDSFGDSWSQLFKVAAALTSGFMSGVQADPLQTVQVVWQPADLMGGLFDEGEKEPFSDLTPEAAGEPNAAATGSEVTNAQS